MPTKSDPTSGQEAETPSGDAPKPRRQHTSKGFFGSLTKLVPFFGNQVVQKKGESLAAFKRRAAQAEEHAHVLQKKFQERESQHRAHPALKQKATEDASDTGFIPVTSPQPEAIPAPVIDDDPMQFLHEESAAPVSHGMWDGPLDQVRKPNVAAVGPVRQDPKPRWFMGWFHLPSVPQKESLSSSPTPVVTEAPSPVPAASAPSTDLDTLLTAPAEVAQVPVQKEEPRREVASVEFLESIEKATPVKVQKETQAKAVASVIPEPPKAVAAIAKPADIVYKPIVHAKQSGFKDFLGSLKTIGLGKEKLSLIQNLATMLDAGLPLVDSLKTLKADIRSRAGRQLLQTIVEAVENGSTLWRALDDQHCFPPDVIALVRIGEEAGNLAENMAYLSSQQEKDQALKSKVKMAMIYPTIVLVIMLIIVLGLGMFVLPNLIGVLFSLGVPLPLVTRMVIGFTNFFTSYGTIAVPGIMATVALLIILGKFTRFRVVAQAVMFRIPGIGRLAREATIARFGVILGGLLQAGVPLVDAIKSLAEVTSIVAYKTFYVRLLEHVSIGDTFGKSFLSIKGSEKLLPFSVQQLVTTGERSGSLSKILLKIADIYEKKANDTAQKLPVILEPMLLIFMGGLVGTIAFAIIVPIYSIVGNVGH